MVAERKQYFWVMYFPKDGIAFLCEKHSFQLSKKKKVLPTVVCSAFREANLDHPSSPLGHSNHVIFPRMPGIIE